MVDFQWVAAAWLESHLGHGWSRSGGHSDRGRELRILSRCKRQLWANRDMAGFDVDHKSSALPLGWTLLFSPICLSAMAGRAALYWRVCIRATPRICAFMETRGILSAFPINKSELRVVPRHPSLTRRCQPNSVVFLDTVTEASAPLTVGSAQMFNLNRSITGFGAFRYPSRNWEALVPLDLTRDNSYIVAFDNTGSSWTGVALAGSSPEPVKLSATVRDESGSVLETASIPMGVNAQASITLSQQFPSTAGKRGTVNSQRTPLEVFTPWRFAGMVPR